MKREYRKINHDVLKAGFTVEGTEFGMKGTVKLAESKDGNKFFAVNLPGGHKGSDGKWHSDVWIVGDVDRYKKFCNWIIDGAKEEGHISDDMLSGETTTEKPATEDRIPF